MNPRTAIAPLVRPPVHRRAVALATENEGAAGITTDTSVECAPAGFLRLTIHGEPPRIWPLYRRAETVLIGSDAKCDLYLVAPGVRPEHLLVWWDGVGASVESAVPGSTREPLPKGSAIAVGPARLELDIELKMAEVTRSFAPGDLAAPPPLLPPPPLISELVTREFVAGNTRRPNERGALDAAAVTRRWRPFAASAALPSSPSGLPISLASGRSMMLVVLLLFAAEALTLCWWRPRPGIVALVPPPAPRTTRAEAPPVVIGNDAELARVTKIAIGAYRSGRRGEARAAFAAIAAHGAAPAARLMVWLIDNPDVSRR